MLFLRGAVVCWFARNCHTPLLGLPPRKPSECSSDENPVTWLEQTRRWPVRTHRRPPVLPRHEDLRDDWPFDRDVLDQLTDAIDAPGEYLLGYPSFTSLAYDPTPGAEWISLLTVYSLDEFDWCWHDGDKLMVFIESEKLKKRDFSNLKSDAG